MTHSHIYFINCCHVFIFPFLLFIFHFTCSSFFIFPHQHMAGESFTMSEEHPEQQKTQWLYLKADDYKILSLLILVTYAMLVPVRKSAIVFAARCEVSSICPSPSHHFLDIPFVRYSFQSSACCAQQKPRTFDPCQRVTKKSLASLTSQINRSCD